jgi:hypothetical protein
MTFEKLRGKALFIISDPGAAKPILALIEEQKKNFSELIIISDRIHNFFKDFNLDVKFYKTITENYIKNYNPSFVFTGTSHKSQIEIQSIYISKLLNIKTYIYLDHSTYLIERFIFKNKINIPDVIYVNDSFTKKNLILESPINILKINILKNPYLKWLKKWKPIVSKEFILNEINIDSRKRIILYLPDPLSNKIDSIDIFGYDELIATKELNKLFAKLKTNFNIVLKPHANQNIDELYKLKHKHFLILSKDYNLNDILYYSDYVIGFFSNSLLEAHAMNKKVIRYQPKNIKYDPFHYKKFGFIADQNSLLNILI